MLGGVLIVGILIALVIAFRKEVPVTGTIFRTPEPVVATERLSEHEQRFVHPRYGFTLDVPRYLTITRIDEGQSTETIIFEPGEGTDPTLPRFQIFITPYFEKTITEARLKKDIPSGVVRQYTDVVIGRMENIPAALFASSDALLGDTREVWFLRNGYLFEVTTRAAHDAWLASILNSWFFITETSDSSK
jgi:hypothetical protein